MIRWTLRLFYNKIDIQGLDNIPKDTPVLFAPNHQNAFMDALVVVAFIDKKLWFLTRADIFKKPLAIFLLNSLRMTPVYRERDNVDTVKMNQQVFHKCYENFNKGEAVLVFPEGNHQAKRTFRPLKKGTARIAFGYKEDMGFDKELAIIPSGITYSEQSMYQGSVKVFHNTPILIGDYMEDYKENPAIALRNMTAKLKEELGEAMLDIPEAHYNVVDKLLKLDEKLFNSHDVSGLQEIADNLTAYLNAYPSEAQDLEEKLSKIPVKQMKKNRPGELSLLISFIGLPLYVASFIALPFFLIVKKVLKSANDEAFKSSLKAVLAMFIGIPFTGILAILAYIFVPGLYYKLGASALIIVSPYLQIHYTNLWKKLRNWKLYPLRSELLNKRDELLAKSKELTV